jgi:FAD:protein FMN transferase
VGGVAVACEGGPARPDPIAFSAGSKGPRLASEALDPSGLVKGWSVDVVAGDDLAVATSGAYVRGRHVYDPHTRRAPEGVDSVTITGPDLATADAYATAAFAMGTKGPAWRTARLRGYEALTVLDDGRVLRTPGFPLA